MAATPLRKYGNGVELIFTGDGPGFTGVRRGITFEGPDGWVWVNRGSIEAEALVTDRVPAGMVRVAPFWTFT